MSMVGFSGMSDIVEHQKIIFRRCIVSKIQDGQHPVSQTWNSIRTRFVL